MMNKDKALVILAPGFASSEDDTTCLTFVQQSISALHKEMPSVKIFILSFEYPFSGTPYIWKGIQVIPFNGRNRPMPYRLLMWVRVWRELTRLHREYELMGILSYWYGQCALIGKWFGKRKQVRHFCWLMGQDARKGNKYARLSKPQPGELVALSQFQAKEFERNYGVRPALVINASINPSLYSKTIAERDIDILGVGSLIPLKRYDLFIEVVKAIKERLPSVRAMICGAGIERNKLEQMIHDSSLQNTIILAGERPYPAILALMQRSKLFLHPSSYEGFGMVCLEALCAGAHVIGFCQPIEEAIEHWHIVETKEEMLAKAIQVLEDPLTIYSPVTPFLLEDTGKKLMQLFSAEP